MSFNLVRRQDVWDPFRELAELQEDMNRFLNRSAQPGSRTGNGDAPLWLPGVDILEEKDRIIVRADLPGMKQEDISVEVADGTLSIKGERRHEAETKDGRFHRIERSYGTFLRGFALPSSVDEARVAASYKNGVLEVTLPKREEVKPKQVKVNIN